MANKNRWPTIEEILKSPVGNINQHLTAKPEIKPVSSKYRNKATEVNGIRFDSKKEAARYKELLLLLKAGKIGQLELQKRFTLIEPNDTEKGAYYDADFTYLNAETGEMVVEDVKSAATRKMQRYVLKRKLMLDKYGIKILET
jgi:hypothetical protein